MATIRVDTVVPPPAERGHARPGRAVRWGALAAVGLLGFYIAVVSAASGISHLRAQLVLDWPWITAIVAGFGVQMGLLLRLRERQRARVAAVTAGSGAGASVVGMLACCAHHVAEIAPLVGVNIAATFLATYRVPFMAVGIAVNAVAVAITIHRLRAQSRHAAHGEEHTQCAA